MATESQIKANRKNAKKSTGPKTPEGKAKSAQNATTHGLTATHDVIKGESQEEFDAHKQAFLDVLNPQDAIEDFLADRVVSLAWRLKRAKRIERELLDGFAADLQYLRQNRPPWDYPSSSQDPDLTLGTAVRRDLDNDKTLDRLRLYERRIESSFFKSLNALGYTIRKKPSSRVGLAPPSQSSNLCSRSSGGKNQTQLSIPENAAISMESELYNLCSHRIKPQTKPNNNDSQASESVTHTSQDRRTTSKKVSTRRY